MGPGLLCLTVLRSSCGELCSLVSSSLPAGAEHGLSKTAASTEPEEEPKLCLVLLLQPEDPALFNVTLLHQRRYKRCEALLSPCKTLENTEFKSSVYSNSEGNDSQEDEQSVASAHSQPAGISMQTIHPTGWAQAVRWDFITKSQEERWNISSLKSLKTLLWLMFGAWFGSG